MDTAGWGWVHRKGRVTEGHQRTLAEISVRTPERGRPARFRKRTERPNRQHGWVKRLRALPNGQSSGRAHNPALTGLFSM